MVKGIMTISRFVDVDGFIRFNITVTPFEMRNWTAERIAAFFNGLAQIVKASGAEVVLVQHGDKIIGPNWVATK